jgi:hypothetical protein
MPMTEAKAKTLAAALGGKAMDTMPQSRMWGVTLTRPDGRYILLEEDAGAVYHDEHACWVGYHTRGDDAEAVVDAWEWGDWGVTEDWATGLATLLGAEAWPSGGNIWVVLYRRPDGRFVVIGDDGAEVYRSREHWSDYDHAGQPEPERVYWS